MNVIMVTRQSRRSKIIIRCDRCSTSWTPAFDDDPESVGARLLDAVEHPCPADAPHRRP